MTATAPQHPATVHATWADQLLPVCDAHIQSVIALADFLGGTVATTRITEPVECFICARMEQRETEPVRWATT